MEAKKFRINQVEELKEVARFLAQLNHSKIILFNGEMGSGKTTLIKALCKELGVEDEVSSPTFSLINHYKTRDQKDIFHFDFYRINDVREALDIGFEEYLESRALCLIEWPEKILQLLDPIFVEVEIKPEESVRMINIHLHP